MKVSEKGVKKEFSEVFCKHFNSFRGSLPKKTPKELTNLMKDILDNLHEYELLLKFVRRYKTAVRNMEEKDAEEILNRFLLESVQNS